MHVGRDDDPELALAPLRTKRQGCRAYWGPWLRAPQPCEPTLPDHLAVQYDHVLRVGTEPRLHGFADGAQLVQWGRVQLRPAKVLDLRSAGVGLGLVATKEEVGGGGRGTGCRGLETRSGACWLCP